MAYAHGTKWGPDLVEETLKEIIENCKCKFFPSQSEIDKYMGNTTLSNAIRRNGGYEYWANKFGMDRKECESSFGYEYEQKCSEFLTNEYGYDCEMMKTKYPYDLTVNKHIKVDVKACRLYVSRNNASYYTFNLEKTNPTCDIYVCYCTKDNEIVKTYVIPSKEVYGKSQLSIGANKSTYDVYLDKWDIFEKYNSFYNQL